MFNKKNRNTMLWPLMLAGILLLCSCSSQEDGPEQPKENPVCMFELSVDLGSPSDTRSSTEADIEEDGTGVENFIDIENTDYRVYLFNMENKLVKELSNIALAPEQGGDVNETRYPAFELLRDGNSFLLRFRVDYMKFFEECHTGKEYSFKIVMLANWGKVYPNTVSTENPPLKEDGTPELGADGKPLPPTTLTELLSSAEITGTFNADIPVSGTNPIPFYGIQQYTNISFSSEVTTSRTTLELRRAFAKIEVYDKNVEDLPNTIESVTLSRYAGNFIKAVSPDYTGSICLPASPQIIETPLPLRNEGTGHFIIYVPEFANGESLSSDKRPRLKIKFAGDDMEYFLDFKYYSGADKDKFYDIQRNFWYVFVVSRKLHDLDLEAIVKEYSITELRPEF